METLIQKLFKAIDKPLANSVGISEECAAIADEHAISFMFWYRDNQHRYPDINDWAYLLDEYNNNNVAESIWLEETSKSNE